MIYTDSGKYAIRAMVHIAMKRNQEVPVPTKGIAQDEAIPPSYLAKVLQALALANLLNSMRGRTGGFRLNRPAENIKVMEVLEAVENVNRITVDCFLGLDQCSDSAPCPMHDTWKLFRKDFLDWANETTIADLALELERKRASTQM